MPAILLDEGLGTRLAMIYGSAAGHAPNKLGLFTSVSGGLSKTSVLADFSEVGFLQGYIPKTVVGGDWSYALDSINHWETATANYSWTFTPGAGLTIAGYFIVCTINNKVEIAEVFISPVIIPIGGGSLALTIVDTYKNCT